MFRKVLLVSLMLCLVAFFSYARAKLVLIHPWAGAEWEQFKPVVEAAEEELGIEIEARVVRSEDLVTLLPTQWAANTAPGDVIFLTIPSLILRGAREGHVLDLTGSVNPDDFLPGSIVKDESGRVFGLPFCESVKPGFWYRKSFFARYGLKEPKTWEEFIELLEEIKNIPGIKAPIASGDGVGWPLSDVTEHFLITFGGPQLIKELEGKKCPPQEWPIIRAIFRNWIADLLKKGYFSEPIEWTTALKMWWNGDYGLYFMGNWITGMVDDPSDLGVFTLPGAKGVTSCIDYIFVSAHSRYPEEAKKLAIWLATRGQEIRARYGGKIATYKPVPIDVYPPAEKALIMKVKNLESLLDLDDTLGGEFQTTFWDQLKLLWVQPDRVDDVVDAIHEAYVRVCAK